jgi:hypothetical protein
MYSVAAPSSGIVEVRLSEAGGFWFRMGCVNASTLGHNLWMMGSVPNGTMEVMELASRRFRAE